MELIKPTIAQSSLTCSMEQIADLVKKWIGSHHQVPGAGAPLALAQQNLQLRSSKLDHHLQ
jgi:hypothetical protein